MFKIATLCLFSCMVFSVQAAEVVYVSELDLSHVEQTWGGEAKADLSLSGKPLSVAGRSFERGLGTCAESELWIKVHGQAQRFVARVGFDDGGGQGLVNFKIITDRGTIYQSGSMKKGTSARKVDIDIRGTEMLILKVEARDEGGERKHANWADAHIRYAGKRPVAVAPPHEEIYILTPKPSKAPQINGAKVFGVRPSHPLLFRIPASGERPLRFSVRGLPAGVQLDTNTGQISGVCQGPGVHRLQIVAENAFGKAESTLTLKVGERIALTPPMGWNSWNCWGCAVDEEKIRVAAKAMVSSGLINYGWAYINIDDCWMRHPDKDQGPVRDEHGLLIPNDRFPDMKGLVRDIHALGLKVGIYTSPGPTTCQGYAGSYDHEMQDVALFAEWGIDYLKYDWCGYSQIVNKPNQKELQTPYRKMRDCLDRVDRDIVFSICQYGWGDVWEWGEDVGGNTWRTTKDIVDTWGSVKSIGFSQHGLARFAKPGCWNDPDMLVVGRLGWGGDLRASRLTPSEQYSHVSLWCFLNAPLLLGCDLTQLDDFTQNLLMNDEVIAVNQDPLGRQAQRVFTKKDVQVWSKPMQDGSHAVGIFNLGEQANAIEVSFSNLGLSGKLKVRDIWRQSDLGLFDKTYHAEVPRHGVVLLRISSP